MSIKEEYYIVGVRQNSSGSHDYSRAANLVINKITPNIAEILSVILSEKELQSLSMQLLSSSEFEKNIILRQLAKKKNVSIEQILNEVRNYKKLQIKSRENGNIRHFHRTSINTFGNIAEMGRLLSRSDLKKERPDFNIPGWSSHDDVMMTRDKFDTDGTLIEKGFHIQEVIGASSSEIILVLSNKIMDLENYDITGFYPTISDLPLQKYCEAILVNSEQSYKKIQDILALYNLKISIFLKKNWKR